MSARIAAFLVLAACSCSTANPCIPGLGSKTNGGVGWLALVDWMAHVYKEFAHENTLLLDLDLPERQSGSELDGWGFYVDLEDGSDVPVSARALVSEEPGDDNPAKTAGDFLIFTLLQGVLRWCLSFASFS